MNRYKRVVCYRKNVECGYLKIGTVLTEKGGKNETLKR